jgi:hypothetical protein
VQANARLLLVTLSILPVYLGDSLLANTEYTAGFYTFQREVKEIDGMNRNNKWWEPE